MTLSSQVIQLNITDIVSNKNQPRKIFDSVSLDTLCESIEKYGIIQPLIVRKQNDKYEIVSGERRYRAAKKIGLSTVPALVGDLTDIECMELSLVENIQNKSLNPLEEGKTYKKILDTSNISVEELEKNIGISKDKIIEKIKLLDLDKEVQKALLKNDISESHAKLLLKVTDLTDQVNVLNKIISDKLTVKETNDYINNKIKEEVDSMNSSMSSALNNLNLNSEPSNVFNDKISVIEERNDNMNNNQNMFFGNNFQSLENQAVNMNTQPNNVTNPQPNQQNVLNSTPVSTGPMINIPTPSFGVNPTPSVNAFVEPTPIVPPTPVDVPNMTYETPITPVNSVMPSVSESVMAPKEQSAPINPFMNLDNLSVEQPTPAPKLDSNPFMTESPIPNVAETPVEMSNPTTPINNFEVPSQPMNNMPGVNPFMNQEVQPEPTMPNFQNIPHTEEVIYASPMATNINPQEPMMQSFSSMPEVNTTPAPFTAPASAPTPTMNNIQLDNAISEVRMAVKNLENRGVIVKLVENDLGASYQIIVEIQK